MTRIQKGLKQKKKIFLLFWLHFIIIGFSFVTNRAYQEALSSTGLLPYDANSKILSTTFDTLKISKSDSNVTSSWRHQFSISSKNNHFPLDMVIDYGNFLKVCWRKHSCEKNIWNSAKKKSCIFKNNFRVIRCGSRTYFGIVPFSTWL